MLKVTFDTNTFDKVVRPHVYAKDPLNHQFVKIHRAIKEGQIAAFICDTMVTLEGIKVDDRADVFGSTTLASTMSVENPETIRVNLAVQQPLRKDLHPKQAERFAAALALGVRLLGAPRAGMPRVEVPGANPYAPETPDQLATRLDRFHEIAAAIEERGLGNVPAKQLAERLACTAGMTSAWFKILDKARDVHEIREVARAIAEWADGDSIAAHFSYGNDIFCTGDEALPGRPSILDAHNRAWRLACKTLTFSLALHAYNCTVR